MIYLLIILTAFWNGLVIAWKHGADTSNLWHKVGFLLRAGYFAIGALLFVPYGLEIINPAFLLSGWHGAVLTLLLCLIFGKYLYDTTINLTRNKYEGTAFKWSYCGSGNQKLWKAGLFILTAITIAWTIFY